MNLQQRKELLLRLGNYMQEDDEEWRAVKEKATADNPWFIPEFIDLAIENIVQNFLQPQQLQQLTEQYQIPPENRNPKRIGVVMAGNIPLVGFHDLMCVLISGNKAIIKPSSKDEALVVHLVKKIYDWQAESKQWLQIREMIPDCDAYIATGSNNSARYFEYYFQKYPSIIRKNRTSVAILTGEETEEELAKLADDVYAYFGLGCRNVTKLFVPKNYGFIQLLDAFKKYDHLRDNSKYKNNYDYNLAIHILNNEYYMTNGSIVLVENESAFSPISQLNYQFYTDPAETIKKLHSDKTIQCIVGRSHTGFGKGQKPGICDYADGVDTVKFLMSLS